MTDDIIRALYSTLDLSFNGGILETYQTPVYAPFSFDLSQPFEVPYIINNFPTLLTDAAEFNGAKERNIFNLEFEKNIQVSIGIPYAIAMDFPKTLTPGTPSDLSVDLVLDTDEAIVSLDYLVHLFGNLSLWFFGEQEIDMLMQNTITLDFGANTLKFGDYELNFQDSYTLELDMFDFIEIVHTGSLNFVGNLIDAEITIKIDEILKHFFPELGWVVDIFFDEINIVIKSDLTGSIDFNLVVDDDEYDVDVSNSSSQIISVTVTPRSTRNSDDVMSIILNDFTYTMEFDVDWVLEIIYSPLLGFFTEELTWDWEIGKWPSFDLFSFQSDSEFTLMTYKATAENLWLRQGSINNDPVQIPGFLAFALIFFTGIGIIINFSLINRKKNRFP